MATSHNEQERESFTEYRTPTREQIARLAHELWLREGRPAGRDREHWLAAERALQFPATVDEQTTPIVPPTDPAPRVTRAGATPRRVATRSGVGWQPAGARGDPTDTAASQIA